MATTKIWAIKDSLSRVVNYAKNPKKTIFSDLKQVLKYAEDGEKTIDKNEKTMYVTGVNCTTETAYEEMTSVQKRFDKCTGNIAYHFCLPEAGTCHPLPGSPPYAWSGNRHSPGDRMRHFA